MKCKICGATCRCRRAGKDICCDCHPHRAAAIRYANAQGAPWTRSVREMMELWEIDHGFQTIPAFGSEGSQQ